MSKFVGKLEANGTGSDDKDCCGQIFGHGMSLMILVIEGRLI